jgi:hypothetical protein
LTKEFAAAPVAALQRHEGWRRPHGTPRGEPHALSWGSVALQGLELDRDRTAMGSVRPARRFHAHRVHSRPSLRPAEADRGPPCAFAPLQRSIFAAPHRTARPEGPASDASSPELLCPTALSKSGGPVGLDGRSLRHPVPRPGFGYPHRGLHHHSSRRTRRRSTLGLLPSRPDRVAAVPLSGPLPSWRFRGAPTRRSGLTSTCAFRASFSRRSRESDRLGPDPRTSLGFTPPEPSLPSSGHSLSVAMPALAPSGGYTLIPTRVTGLYEATGSAGPFPDCRLSWGFAPSDRRGAPYIDPEGWLIASPCAGARLRAASRSSPSRERCNQGSRAPGPAPPSYRCTTSCVVHSPVLFR